MSQQINADNDYFQDENLAYLPADHPLMARLQGALRKTLEEDHERVHLQVKDKEAKLKTSEREKEDTAVQLYEVQQNLAEMHLTLEQTHQNYNLIQKLRVEAEQKLTVLNQEGQTKQVQMEHLGKNLIKAQDELSKITLTLKQIETYNEQMKSEIAVTRRTTYRAEENIGLQEKAKKKQDLLIDHLTEQKKKLNEQIVIIEAQYLAQTDETKAAKDILKEAFGEMENIIASKKNLLDRWQKSLLEMQRRDKALQVAREALQVQYEKNVQISAEIAGVKNEIRKEAAVSETLASNHNRLKLEEKRLEDEKQKLDHDYQKLYAQIKILKQSLESTETSGQGVERENKKVEEHMNIIEDNIMKIHTQARSLFDQVINKISEHKTLEKKSANLLKQAQVIGQTMEEKDIEKENAENEIARVNIDSLNTTNQIEALKKKKREVSEERKKKEDTVRTYEIEIRQGHDINEKKQSEVGKLNKIHDEISNNSSEMSRGPMEAQKAHLVNQLKEKNEQVQLLERDWIKKQTNLVKYQQHFSTLSEENSNLKTKKTILEQKKMRLNTIFENHGKEIRSIKIALKNLQTEMNKLNDGLSKNSSSEEKLKNENFNIQSEFVEKLKELESTNVKLEVDIDSRKEEKAELLQNIVEAERQLLLWERKIQLEKEIQEALDPNIGQSEIKLLKKDIHMMELRLDELRKQQEVTITEMERAVYKRDTIQLKYTKPDEGNGKPGKETKTQISKQIETLRGALSQTSTNNKEYDKKLKQLQAQMEERNNEMNMVETETSKLEQDYNDKSTELNQKRVERLMGVFEVVKRQTRHRAYESIAANKLRYDAPEHQLRQRLEKQKEMNSQILDVFKELTETYPQYNSVFQSLVSVKVE